jgi:beta-lactamase class A
MWNDAALAESGFCHWNYGKTRDAANCSSRMGGDNFFTANDAALFMTQVWDRSLLGEKSSAQLLQWMTLSPRSGYGGWLGTQLPAAARPTMHHKAGWLPPDAVPGYSNSNEIGVVEIPGGRAYAVALLLSGGSDYNNKQLPTLEYASCAVYHGVARDLADPFGACTHP